MSSYDYDLIVIGGGSGGLAAALTAQNLGKRVAIVEKHLLGGENTWSSSIPTKALVHTAKIAWQFKNMAWAGLTTENECRLDTSSVLNHVRSISQRIYSNETPETLEKKGINVFIGEPRFINSTSIFIEHETLSAPHMIIATGSQPLIPSIEGINSVAFLTNTSFFQLPTLPLSLIIVGGGPSGIEFAQALNRLGVKVFLFEQFHFLPQSEPELSKILIGQLKDEGIHLYDHTRIIQIQKHGKNVVAIGKNTNGELTVQAEHILFATGRVPNSESLNVDDIQITTEQNAILVNDYLQTSTNNIYAVGDVIGTYHYSHAAEYQAKLAVQNALLPVPRKKIDYTKIPSIIFSDPEFAHVGLTEEQAGDIWEDIKTIKIPYKQIDKAVTDLAETGLAKLVFNEKELVGIDILGAHAGELMQHFLTIKEQKIPFKKLNDMIYAYPLFSELLKCAGNEYYKNHLDNKWYFKTLKKLS